MNDAVKDEQIANPLEITKERLREWSACTSGYGWFLEKFPQGGMFGEVYNALRDDRRYEDSDWLINHVFAELDTGTKAVQLVSITGADKAKIEQQVKDYGGKEGEVATTGDRANAATTGDRANAATTGYWANAATTGNLANAATTGDWANAATTGYRANAATTGEHAVAAAIGEHAVAAAIGTEGKAKASVGGAIVLCYRNDNGHLIHIRASKVGENGIKPDVWYSLDDVGEFIESEA